MEPCFNNSSRKNNRTSCRYVCGLMDFIVDLTPGMMIFMGIDVVITPRNTKIITTWDYIDIDSFQNITHSNRPSLPRNSVGRALGRHCKGDYRFDTRRGQAYFSACPVASVDTNTE